ncbi:MAG: hypothetical protein Q4P36_04685 [Bowdeniella nasicola]|nr:hypothetical protein [Bowdeniella nasicola]
MAVIYVPGLACARLMSIKGFLAWVSAPLFAAVISVVGSTASPLVGARWGVATYASVAGVLMLGLAVLRRTVGPRVDVSIRAPSRIEFLILAGAYIALILPLILSARGDAVIQQIDSTFHMNALWLVNETGDASSFGALTPMYGLETTRTNFPAGWHSLVSLVSGQTRIVESINAMALLVPLVWVMGLGALVVIVHPRSPARRQLTYALIPLAVVFPTFLISRYPALPNAYEISLLPSLLTFVIIAVRSSQDIRQRLVLSGLTTTFLACVFLIHPSVIFTFGVYAALPLMYLFARHIRSLPRGQRIHMGKIVAGVGGVAVLGVIAVLAVPGIAEKLHNMTTMYQTERGAFWVSLPKTLTAWPYITAEAGSGITRPLTLAQISVAVLLLIGAVRSWRTVRGRLIFLTWFGCALLTFTTLWRAGPLVPLAGLWYMSPHRTMAIQIVPQTLLTGIGLDRLLSLLRCFFRQHKRQVIGAGVVFALLVSGGLTFPARFYLFTHAYSPTPDDVTYMASAEEIHMIRNLEAVVPEGSLVLGDPFNGSALVQAVGNIPVVFPQLYFRDSNHSENLLRRSFDQREVEPQICHIIGKHGITHLYVDSDSTSFGQNNRLLSPGLYDVDVSFGLTKVASGGSASVWRIDECGARD